MSALALSREELARKNRAIAVRAIGFVTFMLGLAYASVPLYQIFCDITGFGGTPQRAAAAPGKVANMAPIGVRFDSNINPALPWEFKPGITTVRVAPGERVQMNYVARNLVARATAGTSTFNVSPAAAGQYFSKMECFCFTEQTLKGGQKVDMPVVFFVDPKIRTDPATKHIEEITLSYTFFPLEKAAEAS